MQRNASLEHLFFLLQCGFPVGIFGGLERFRDLLNADAGEGPGASTGQGGTVGCPVKRTRRAHLRRGPIPRRSYPQLEMKQPDPVCLTGTDRANEG